MSGILLSAESREIGPSSMKAVVVDVKNLCYNAEGNYMP